MLLNSSASQIFAEMEEVQKSLEPVEEDIKRSEDAAKIAPCTCDHLPDIHDQDTGRCPIRSCNCRKPEPDSAIGGYEKQSELQRKFFEILVYKLYPAYIRWGVKDIQGLSIDGSPATPETFISDMPEPVVSELGSEIQRLIRMSADESLGFSKPTTSVAAVDGHPQTTDPSTATPANVESTTSSATVVDSTPNS